MRKVLPITQDFHGSKIRVTEDGKKFWTPMIVVFIAIGTTDLLFALDSIPAIFGLTKEPFIVFTANVFALMGLRQLYFLLGGLLDRLVYLSLGLAVVLAFIGVKLVLEALHEQQPAVHQRRRARRLGAGDPDLAVADVILGVLVVATVASLLKTRGPAPGRRAAGGAGQPPTVRCQPRPRRPGPAEGHSPARSATRLG